MEDHRWATGDEGKERAGEGGERKRQETAAASGDRQSLSDARRFRSGIVAAPEEITGGAQGEAPQRRRREMTAASGGPQSLSDVSRFRLGCHRWAAGNEGREIQGEAKKRKRPGGETNLHRPGGLETEHLAPRMRARLGCSSQEQSTLQLWPQMVAAEWLRSTLRQWRARLGCLF